MTSDFRDLDEVLGGQRKELPIRGKLYQFPARVSDRTGMKLTQLSALARKRPELRDDASGAAGESLMQEIFSDAETDELYEELLGGAQQQLVDDGVPPEWQLHVVGTLMAWHTAGRDAAVKVWEGKKPGEAQAPNRETRRRGGSGSAAATRSRGSSSDTSPQKAASKRAAGGSSRGAKSSSTGR